MCRRFLPVGVLLTIVAGSSARAQMPFPRDLLPTRTSLERLGLERQWYNVVPLVETERLLRISRTADLLLAQTNYARLHAFDPESGRHLWTATLGERSGLARGAAANSFAVFVTNANMLFALDRGSGRTLWKTNLGTIPTSTPACDESHVMVGMTNGLLMGFYVKKTDSKGKTTILDAPAPAWNWHAGGPIHTRPVPAETMMVWGGGDNKVYATMADERTTVWRFATGGPIGEGLGVYGTRTLLIPSGDFVLYAVDLLSAQSLWQFPSGAPIFQEPLVADEDVFVVNTAGNLTLLNPTNGEPRWTTATQGGRLTSIGAKTVYLRSYNLDLFLVDRATGRMMVDPSETHLRAGLNLREYDLDIVNRFNDRIYFATDSGLILCLRELGQTQPRLLRDPKAPPFGYVPPEGIKPTPPTPPGAEPEAQPKTEAAPAAEPAAQP
ncbi:MAG TPA: PQQ-binding-like beta-propeller repeat protein [Isosphaeraceae bacterium]|nr:PQQ-binding-like beta-propeller repeat protein [Isosphaeraceae bacterium]